MIAGVDILVDGVSVDATIADLIVEVSVEDHLMLPDMFTIRISDPRLEHIDSHPFAIGADVQIQFAPAQQQEQLAAVITGQVTSLEPSFRKDRAVLAVRGYDYSHALNRSRQTATYQNVTVGDVAQTIARRVGLEVGEIANDGGVHEFIQQNNESDWQFLWRLAHRVGLELVVLNKTLHFRTPGGGASTNPIPLRWGEELTEFRPRLTGVQQVDEVVVAGWDPVRKETIEATAKAEGLLATIGIERSAVVGALSGGTFRMASNPVMTREEAEALAKAVAGRVGNAYLEADGEAAGNPTLRAGTSVRIDGLGAAFSGTYTLASSTHLYRGGVGYVTRFTISGRADRSLVELSTPATPTSWGSSVAVAIVTQNTDPDNMGRVRVRYPELGESAEGWWARVTAMGAGADKGVLMMPTVGDEVLVAFEHNDVRRPYVIGAVWNGQDRPGELVQDDGSLAVHSRKRATVTSDEAMRLASDQEIVLVAGEARITLTESGEITITGGCVRVSAESLDVSSDGSIRMSAGSAITISAPQVSIG